MIVKIVIDSEKVDRLITILHERCQADPDSAELAEDLVNQLSLNLSGEDFKTYLKSPIGQKRVTKLAKGIVYVNNLHHEQ